MSLFNWKVLFVKPRCEKKVAEYCSIYGIEYYLPLHEKQRIVQRRKVKVLLPLFSGYVFANFSEDRRLSLLKTNCLVSILEPESGYRLARDLVMVRKALLEDPGLSPLPTLKRGMRVRIKAGPFMGIEGLVIDLKNRGATQVILNIEMIGQAVSVMTDAIDLEPLPSAR